MKLPNNVGYNYFPSYSLYEIIYFRCITICESKSVILFLFSSRLISFVCLCNVSTSEWWFIWNRPSQLRPCENIDGKYAVLWFLNVEYIAVFVVNYGISDIKSLSLRHDCVGDTIVYCQASDIFPIINSTVVYLLFMLMKLSKTLRSNLD